MSFTFEIEDETVVEQVVETDDDNKNKPFERDISDNKLFREIQVDDITTIIDDKTVCMYDADTPLYQVAGNMEIKGIRVTCKKDKNITEDLKNVTMFSGRGKSISDKSWLGVLNIEREIQGLEPLTVEDFDIEETQTLKMDEDKALEAAKIQIYKRLKTLREQYKIKNITLVVGEGDNFRHKLDLCRPYKGGRDKVARPLLLKKVRAWAKAELDVIEATPRDDGEMVEADDVVEYYGHLGYQEYRKNGKFSYLVIATDKDALNNPKLLINPDTHKGENNPLRGKFKNPQPMLIEASDKSIGDVEQVVKPSSTEVKGYGAKFLMYQSLLGGDSADNYSALSHLPFKFNFGDLSAYKVLKPCKTMEELLQSCVNVFANLLPYGVQYETHKGTTVDVDTMTYMNTYFLVAYMLRSPKDTFNFYKLCKHYKIDTSKVIGNNKLTPPVKTFVPKEKEYLNLKSKCEELIGNNLVKYKGLKKPELVALLDKLLEGYTEVSEMFDDQYDMVQHEKEVC